MQKLRILYVAYQFPPESGPAVHRNFEFANGLAKKGHEVTVWTRSTSELGTKNQDDSYAQDLSENLRIVRTSTHELKELSSLLMKWGVFRPLWFLFYKLFWEKTARWFKAEHKSIEALHQNEKFDLIYTSSGPFSTMQYGAFLEEKYGVKWIADLRDPFTDAYMWNFPSKLHWLLMRTWERKMFSKPDELIVTTPSYKKLLCSRGLRKEENVNVVTNGY